LFQIAGFERGEHHRGQRRLGVDRRARAEREQRGERKAKRADHHAKSSVIGRLVRIESVPQVSTWTPISCCAVSATRLAGWLVPVTWMPVRTLPPARPA